MCKALSLNYNIFANHYHKGLRVEYFHRFLNKVITIAMDDRESSNLFILAGIAAAYA